MRTLFMGSITSLFLIWMIGSLIFMLIGFGVIVCLGHAVCHMPPAGTNYGQVIEEEQMTALSGDVGANGV